MSGSVSGNPLVPQGTLNRIRTHIVLASYPALNVTSANMSRGFATFAFEGNFAAQIETATGIVTSPEPYVMGTCTVELLRTQSLAAAYLAQVQSNVMVGTVTGYSDSVSFPPIVLNNCSIYNFDPGAFDGTKPAVRVVFRGVFTPNAAMWGLTF